MNLSEKLTGTTVVGIIVVVLVAVGLGAHQFLLGPLSEKLAQTKSATAVITKVEYRGEGSQISYRFWDGDRSWSGTSLTRRYARLTPENASGVEIEIWFNPLDPKNSSPEKPNVLLGWMLLVGPLAFILLSVVCYLIYLDDLWSWGIIKRKEE